MRPTFPARWHLLVLFVAAFGWLLGISFQLTRIIDRAVNDKPLTLWHQAALVFSPALVAAAYLFLAARLPELAARARVFPGRALGGISLIGALAIWLGATWTRAETFQVAGP